MCFLLAFICFRVQGSRGGFAAFFIGRCPKDARKWYSSHGLSVTSRFYDTREGIVSHVWHEILRLSPHLFWRGLFTHRAFSSAQDDDTGERVVSRSGGFAAFFDWAMPKSGIQVMGYQS